MGKGIGFFLDCVDVCYFEGCLYIDYICILYFVFVGLKSLEKVYVFLFLVYKEYLYREDYRKLEVFFEGVDNVVSIL